MARIPESEIERIKQEVSVLQLIESSGISLKKVGKDFVGLCPFHDDKNPSLRVTPSTNLWCCRPCDIGGGPIQWVMRYRGASFRHAFEMLHDDPSLAAKGGVAKHMTGRVLAAPVSVDTDDQKLMNDVSSFYFRRAQQVPALMEYLASRGLNAAAVMETFQLGIADRMLGLRLPTRDSNAGKDLRSRLQKLGVFRESGHEHLSGSLVIPLLDEHGNVVQMYGRKLLNNLRAGTPKHLYLPGPHRGIFNRAALNSSREIVVCEALIDALTFWCAGIRNVISAFGAGGFTDEMLQAFKAHRIERVLIAFDADETGDRGAEKLAERLMAEGFECFRVRFPKGMDANEYALKVQPAEKSLAVAVRSAEWMGKGVAPVREPTAHELLAVDAVAAAVAASVVAEEKPSDECGTIAPEAMEVEAALPSVQETVPLPVERMPVPPQDVPVAVDENEVRFQLADRFYRVRGYAKNTSPEVLRVNVLASFEDRFHVDSLDLYSAKARASFVAQAANELLLEAETIRSDLGKVLLKLEAIQDERLRVTLEPVDEAGYAMSETERSEALALLQSRDLIARILSDLTTCGLVGEDTNKLVGYLGASSRKLSSPLAVMVRSSSAAGKSSLMDAVLAVMPEEETIKYSAMTGQSLFYIGETNLKHKILAIAEEEGASRASYALKLLQSEGELTIASTGKDPVSGNMVTQQYRVEGPVMIFLTTTAMDLDDELLNRCLVLTIDEGRAQTQAIHQQQREKHTLEGIAAGVRRQHLRGLHKNVQRLLRPLRVFNPYARALSFPDSATRTRRDHEKYMTLINTIALLHQYQRPIKKLQVENTSIEYVEATLDDIALANELAHEVLGRSLDELPPQTRKLLVLIDEFVTVRSDEKRVTRSAVRFTRRELREAIHWGHSQLAIHLDRLLALEYLFAYREGMGGKYVYELAYDGSGEDGSPRLQGLIEVETLRQSDASPSMTENFRGPEQEVPACFRGDSGPVPGGFRGELCRDFLYEARDDGAQFV